jgi:hypothetical protein
MDTLALDAPTWDLTVDAYGSWATVGDATPQNVQTGPGMRLAQDASTSCLTWAGECYYDTTRGVRYQNILGAAPNLTLLQSEYSREALKVPGCASALPALTFTGGVKRIVTGTLTVSDQQGNGGAVQL